MKEDKVGLKYLLVTTSVVIFTWLIHEFGHWLACRALGYEAFMSLNRTTPLNAIDLSIKQRVFISSAGPLVTILQGYVAYKYLKIKLWNKYIYPVLFTAFYMRLLAGFMNFININDEGRIGGYLEIGTFTLPMLVSGLLFFMVYKTSRRFHLNWKFQLLTTLIVLVISSFLILSDQFLKLRIL